MVYVPRLRFTTGSDESKGGGVVVVRTLTTPRVEVFLLTQRLQTLG
jgi:hypothetical protein